jgi:hypothetical protein
VERQKDTDLLNKISDIKHQTAMSQINNIRY